jgi:four helix bundle protein
VAVYGATQSGRFARDTGLRTQIQRAAVSVMSNIAEGFDRNSRAEFARFLAIARGSAGEVRSQLHSPETWVTCRRADSATLIEACVEITRCWFPFDKSSDGEHRAGATPLATAVTRHLVPGTRHSHMNLNRIHGHNHRIREALNQALAEEMQRDPTSS